MWGNIPFPLNWSPQVKNVEPDEEDILIDVYYYIIDYSCQIMAQMCCLLT